MIDTPSGPETLLPAGSDPTTVPLPKASPPYASINRVDVAVVRDPDGAIAIRCDACAFAEHVVYLPADGKVRLSNVESGDLAWDRDLSNRAWRLRWRVNVLRPFASSAGFTRSRPVTKFETLAVVTFATPAENVVAARIVPAYTQAAPEGTP
jgi:hypothetical protein